MSESDLFYLLLTLVLFVTFLGFVQACERLMRSERR